MQSRRKVIVLHQTSYDEIHNAIRNIDVSAPVQHALEKDAPLIAAALATDRVIISLDDRARSGFATYRPGRKTLTKMRWFNPARDFEQVRTWLAAGK